MLAASLPNYSKAPEALIEWVLELYGILQREVSLSMLLKTVNESSTEELLRFQPAVRMELDRDFEQLGGLDSLCQRCSETKGLMTAAAIPISVRLERIDFEAILKSLPEPPDIST
jgi:hypothetical protein